LFLSFEKLKGTLRFAFASLQQPSHNKGYIQSLLSVVTPALQLVLGLPLSKNLLAFFGGQGI
jgi:hypothetical protein